MRKLLLLLSLLFLVGCAVETEDTTKEKKVEAPTETTDETTAEAETDPETEAEVKDTETSLEIGNSVNMGSFLVTVKEYKLIKDHEGNDGLRITYDAENTGEEDNSPGFALIFRGYQNSVETEDKFFISDDLDLGLGQRTVKPGGKIENAQNVVDIDDLSKPLEIELIETFSFDDNKATILIEDLSQYE